MEIIYKGKRYKWKGTTYGNLTSVSILGIEYSDVFISAFSQAIRVNTHHTPDQLVALGYMEEIKEENPTEAPQYWFIETEAMKKSEYWEVFNSFIKEETCSSENIIKEEYFYFQYGSFGNTGTNGLHYIVKNCTHLSPQQWYDLIYKPDHDKAMDVVEVPEYKYNKRYANSSGSMYYSEPEKEQLEIHAKAIQQLQQKVFNK